MPKKVVILLAEGFEEVEAITPIDYLRRVGIELTVAAVGLAGPGAVAAVKGSHGIQITADTNLRTLLNGNKLISDEWDGVIVPGGLPGSDNLAASEDAAAFIKAMAAAGKLVCAICAAPARVLSPLGLLAGKKYTCYPGEEAKVPGFAGDAEWKEDRVVIDGNIITSRGAGTAGEFACAIISKLLNEAEGKKLAERVLLS